MTCAAYDGRVLAVDKRAGVGVLDAITTKLTLIPEQGIALACSGNGGRCREFAHWVRAGRDHDTFPAFQRDDDQSVHALVILNGAPFLYSQSPIPLKIENRFFAIGSGAEVAIGAMAAGATAIRAVEIANEHVDSCGRGVDWAECKPPEFSPERLWKQMVQAGLPG